jgi:hypothetical protein
VPRYATPGVPVFGMSGKFPPRKTVHNEFAEREIGPIYLLKQPTGLFSIVYVETSENPKLPVFPVTIIFNYFSLIPNHLPKY